jgi:phosphate transport system substrate-binding protein
VTAFGVGCSKPSASTPAAGTSPKSAAGAAAVSGTIAIDGSSTVYPVSEAVAEEFQRETKGAVRVTVGIKGTGGGFKRFCVGETDISNASRPILKEEMELARTNNVQYIELPICFDALTVAVHPANDWVKSITVDELKRMWEPSAQGTIKRWNQIRPDWPNEELALFGAGADSGTFDYFTEAVVGKAKSSRGDFTASEDDNVLVQGIAGNKYALGFLPYAYYAPNSSKLKAVAVDWDKDQLGPVLPSAETVINGTYNPLSRPLFIYVKKTAADRPEVTKFVEFFLTNAPQLATEVKYVPLPAKAYEMALARFKSRETGSAFGGVPEVGLPVEEILKREPKH